MKVLIVGGAGHVGRIIRAGFMRQHDCRFFDRVPVPGLEDRSIVGDVNDDDAVRSALATGIDAVIYAPLGKSADGKIEDIDAAFDVNTKSVYRWLVHAMGADVRRFVQASSLSVHRRLRRRGVVTEQTPADAWDSYGISKALAEQTCAAASARYPDRTIVVLRLMLPQDEAAWQEHLLHPRTTRNGQKRYPLGPQDTTRLFLAAVACDAPGLHLVQATGDVDDEQFPNRKAHEILGWRPRGE